MTNHLFMHWNNRNYSYAPPQTIEGMVSIIIPTYNREAFLLDRLTEIEKSTYQNFEIIVVNDGGDSLSGKLPSNVKLIELEQNSQSVSIPRNIGISYARGEFICPADDDVRFLPEKLELLVNNIEDGYLCYGNRSEIYLDNNQSIQRQLIVNWNPLLGAGIDNGQYIYRKSVYERIPYVISTHACDYHLAKEIFKYWGRFKWIHNTVSEYIWHKNNRTYSETRKHVPLDIAAFKSYFNVHNEFLIVRE